MFIFGAGDMFAVPLFDASGNAVSNPTPIRLATLQEMSVDFSGDVKKLYGQQGFATVIARGKVDLTGKVKGASVNGATLNTLFFAQTMTSGTQVDAYVDNTGTVIPTTPFTITPTPPNSGTWQVDLGVTDGFGVPYTRVASAPATGQYAVAAGVYTFASADAAKTVFISFQYSATVVGAKKISVQNLTMGAAPSFKAFMRTTFNGKKALVVVYGCVAQKLAFLSTKLDDFNIPEFDFTGQQDPLGTSSVCDIYVQE